MATILNAHTLYSVYSDIDFSSLNHGVAVFSFVYVPFTAVHFVIKSVQMCTTESFLSWSAPQLPHCPSVDVFQIQYRCPLQAHAKLRFYIKILPRQIITAFTKVNSNLATAVKLSAV